MGDDSKGKFTSDNICCFGVTQLGLLVGTVVAHMCPNITVTLVDPNPEKITLSNTKLIPFSNPKLAEMLRLSQNRNLIITSNTENVVKMSHIILICLNSTTEESGNKKKKVFDLIQIENAMRYIAKVSESNKIVAVKSTVPIGANEVLKRILNANKVNGVEFQVISFPEFLNLDDAVSCHLSQDRISMGSDLSTKALQAMEKLGGIFSWVHSPKVHMIGSRSVELAKIIGSAIQAQVLSNTGVMSIMCETLGADLSEIYKVLGSLSNFYLETSGPTLGFEVSHLKKHLTYLVQLCEDLKLQESADYWRQVLILNEFYEKRFLNKILSSFYNTLSHKTFAIWGLESNKNVEAVSESLVIDLCHSLVLEGAKLNLYVPKKEGRQLISEFKASGLEEVTYCEDPYKAARKADAIIVLSKLEDFDTLDFKTVYRDMGRPARIFDGRSCLPHQKLINIGFHVETIGKKFQGKQSFNYLD